MRPPSALRTPRKYQYASLWNAAMPAATPAAGLVIAVLASKRRCCWRRPRNAGLRSVSRPSASGCTASAPGRAARSAHACFGTRTRSHSDASAGPSNSSRCTKLPVDGACLASPRIHDGAFAT